MLCQKLGMPVDPNHSIARDLLAWYRQNARVLPWRQPPGSSGATPDPYGVWLAEILLQQTTVATAIPRYQRFLARFPDLASLAAAPLDAVLHEWAGLGYYARARNLHAAAQLVAARGGFPETAADLRGLPGVGSYTAAAIAAIAFGEAVVPLDTNLLRVGARLFAVAEQPARARVAVNRAWQAIVPADAPGDFAQAIMDLGATICTPVRPACLACPLSRHCAARATGQPEAFPMAVARRERPVRKGNLWWLEHEERVALVRRPASGLLGGLLALPGSAWTTTPEPPPAALNLLPTGLTVRHAFTHFALELRILSAALPWAPAMLNGQPILWTARDQLGAAGLPTLYAKAVAAMLATPPATCFEAA